MGTLTSMIKLARWIDRQPGWRVARGKAGHYKCFAPDGTSIITLSTTPGKYKRAWPNTVADFRRAGLEVPTF